MRRDAQRLCLESWVVWVSGEVEEAGEAGAVAAQDRVQGLVGAWEEGGDWRWLWEERSERGDVAERGAVQLRVKA